MFVYIDETGDLGFSSKSSKYFILVGVVVESNENRKYENTIKKVLSRNKPKVKEGEIKFNNSKKDFRIKVLKEVKKRNIKIYYVYLEKKNFVRKNLSFSEIYFSMTKNLIEVIFSNIDFRKENKNRVDIFIDKSMRKKQLEKFKEELKDYLKNFQVKTKTHHLDSHNNKGLSVTDFVCGSIGKKYNKKEIEYYDIIKEKIKEGRNAFSSQA